MLRARHYSIATKLTRMNMLVSGAALLLACAAFITYDLVSFRDGMVHNLSIQAQVAGSNSVSALLFSDPHSAENTLSALNGAPNIVSAGIYTLDGRSFATYRRDGGLQDLKLPPIPSGTDRGSLVQGSSTCPGTQDCVSGQADRMVYIRSDLQEMTRRFKRYAGIAAIVLLVSLIAALLVASVFQRAVAEPIVHLAEISRIVSRDKNYSMRATPTGNHDEPDLLIGAFNEMLGQIQEREGALRKVHERVGEASPGPDCGTRRRQ